MSGMFDFVQTMKDWRRMCKQMDKEFGMDGCEHCPLVCCSAVYESDGREDYAEIARKVAEWVQAHPEPRYPTFGEWLCDIGELTGCGDAKEAMRRLFNDPIPAELAEKLEIEPKPRV